MNETLRNILFRSFVAIFVVLTIVMSLYATGYSLSFSWPLKLNRLLQKTGTLALDSDPKGASIYINGKEQKNSAWFGLQKSAIVTPIKVKHLLPGEYTVTFELDGYWTYEKKVGISPEQTTFLEDVNLFRKSLALNVYPSKAQKIEYAPNGRYAYLPEDGKIVDLVQEAAIATSTGAIQWLDSGNSFMNGGKITSLKDKTAVDYSSLVKEPATNWQWCSNSSMLLFCSGNLLNVYNQQTQKFDNVSISGQPLAYQNINKDLFLVAKEGQQAYLSIYSFTDKTFSKKISIISSKDFSFETSSNGTTLYDGEHHVLYLLADNADNPITDIIDGVTAWTWLSDNKIAYVQGIEIYLYDLAQKNPFLITRWSESINSLAWNPKKNYLIFATENSINTINFANAGNDMTTIWQGSDISSLHLDTNDEVLYFSGTIGQQSGLYKLQVR